MQLHGLSELQYAGTFSTPMHRLGADEDAPVYVDVGTYLQMATRTIESTATLDSMELTDIYIGANRRYTHLLFDYGLKDARLVVVVDNELASIYGHRVVDFARLYTGS